jgi:hypothetical protein
MVKQLMKMAVPVLLLTGGLQSCIKNKGVGEVDGYKPVYMSNTEARAISVSSSTSTATTNPGKIVALGSLLFQVDVGRGIQVINMSNPAAPAKIGYIKINGCQEMSIKNGYIYANNYNDMVVLNVGSFSGGVLPTLTVTKRLENAFPQALNGYPPNQGSYFECADPSKGVVVGWTLTKLTNPKCRR